MAADASIRPNPGEPLRCPSCASRLVEIERSEILIDACPQCRGIWLDRGELDKILVKERSMAASDPDEDFFREVEGRRAVHERPDNYAGEERSGKKRRRRSILEDLLDFG